MIVFDLDGTLALDAHRAHHLSAVPKDWDSYFAAARADTPNWPLIALLDGLLWDGQEVEIWSGRSMSTLDATAEWFKEVFDGKERTNFQASLIRRLPFGLEIEDDVGGGLLRLRLRHQTDRTEDTEMKRGWLKVARQGGQGGHVGLRGPPESGGYVAVRRGSLLSSRPRPVLVFNQGEKR